MAIIYTYPVVTPTSNDLVLGTDVDAQGKPTKNFTVQSIIDLVTVSGNDLQAVLNNGNTATQNIVLTGNISATQFTDGTITIGGGVASGFTTITSTNFAGNLTGVVKAGSSIQGTVTGVTQALGTNNTTLATTAFVQAKVDPSVLQYRGDATGPFDLNLVNDDFKITGTANQIQTTATAVAGNIGTINLKFPTAGVVLPNGSTATTQAAADNTTKVATDAFVQQENNAQDLDFIGDTGTSSVLLNSQTLDFEGTANQIVTAVTAQKVKFSLPSSVTIGGTFTGTTFAGDLLGTVNTATTGVTQNAGDDSTKIATTEYVDNAAGAKTLDYAGDSTGPFTLNLSTDDLEFNGDSNITVTAATVTGNKGIVTVDLNNNVTITGTSKAGTFTTTAGTATWTTTVLAGFTSITSTVFVGALTGNASTATALAASGAIALSGDTTSTGGPHTYTSGGAVTIPTTIANTTVTGKTLLNLPTPSSSAITASDTILAAMAKLQGQITGIPKGLVYKGTWNATTNTPTLASSTGVTGEFYIVSVAGNTNLNGITDWQIGDWAIFVEVGATDTWQKIDNSQSITGSGATNKITKWTAPTVLGTGLIEDDGTDVTIGNSGNLIVEGNTTLGNADTDSTTVKGPARFEETLRVDVGIGLGGATYGTAGQVLTSGGGAASVNTWTTPTTGTVTSVGLTETGNALNITNTPITTSGNINIAGAGSASQYINGELNLATFPIVDNYISWTLAGDTGSSQTISSTNTATFAGGFGISTVASATDTLTTSIDITGTDNAIAGLTAATPVATDTLWFNDISDSNTIRKATIADIVDLGNETLAQVLANGNTTGGTDIAVSAGDDITFTSTSKAIFNTALEISEDGSSGGVIKHDGTGGLVLKSDAVNINGLAGGVGLQYVEGGAISLRHNNSLKLATTGTGISITGGLTAGTGNFSGNVELKSNAGGATKFLRIWNEGTVDATDDALITWQTQASRTYSMGIHRDSGLLTITNQDASVASGELITVDTNGNTVISGNLTVDGHIIHGGGGGGTGKGGQFTKLFTSQSGGSVAFTIDRASTGAMVFDVMLTSDTSSTTSIAKKYTVVATYGTTAPIYNKILDTGPDANGADFTVVFAADGTSNTKIKCTITPVTTAVQKIGITIDLGFGQNNATVVMN
jgi:hypothetical protein